MLTARDVRLDFRVRKSGKGKKCGESHIPKEHECQVDKPKKQKLRTAATVALGAGVAAAAAYGITRATKKATESISIVRPAEAKPLAVKVKANERVLLSRKLSESYYGDIKITQYNAKHNYVIGEIEVESRFRNYVGAIVGLARTPDGRYVSLAIADMDDEGFWNVSFKVNGNLARDPAEGKREFKDTIAVLSRVERMLQASIKNLPDDDELWVEPLHSDDLGEQRAKVYKRFGFERAYDDFNENDSLRASVGKIKQKSRRNDALRLRLDARRKGKAKGKKCGNTYISRKYRCNPDGSSPEPDGITPRRLRRVALTAGLLAGGALAGYAWSREWDRRQSEARLISPARRKPDPEAGYLRQRRLAAFRRACGGRADGVMTDLVAAAVDEVDRGKLAAGGVKLAVAGSVPRLGGYCQAATQIGERSAAAKLYLHTNSETVFKVPLEIQDRNSKERTSKLSAANVIKSSEYEALVQAQAHSVGVQTPAIRAFNRRTGVIAMEYADGYVSLRDWATSGQLDRDRPRALQAMKSLRDSMLKANLAGLVHQDLHPGNVLVNPASLKIKIIDWGEAFSKAHKHPVYDTYAHDAGFTNGLNIDMEMVVRRSWRPFNMDDTAAHMWLVHHHRPLYNKIDNDEPFTLPMLQKYMSAWYRDVDRLVEWQQRNPGRTIGLTESIL